LFYWEKEPERAKEKNRYGKRKGHRTVKSGAQTPQNKPLNRIRGKHEGT